MRSLSLPVRVRSRLLVARLDRELRIAACAHDGSNGTCPYCLSALSAGLPFPAQLPPAGHPATSTPDRAPHPHQRGDAS